MDLEVVGRHALLFDDDATAAFVNSGDALVDWNSLLIDRYDVRHLLSSPPPPRRRRNLQQTHSPPSVSSIESELDHERYLDLPPPEEEQESDEGAKLADASGYHAVTFLYGNTDDSTDQKNYVAGLVDSRFHPPFPVPESLLQSLPPTEKLHQIIARTAMFVSKHGGQSEIVLRVKQGENPTFGFLMPDHHLHAYFRFLVDRQELLQSNTDGKSEAEKKDYTEINHTDDVGAGALSMLGSVYGSGEDEDGAVEDVPESKETVSGKDFNASDPTIYHGSRKTEFSENVDGKEETVSKHISPPKEKAQILKRNSFMNAPKAGPTNSAKKESDTFGLLSAAEDKPQPSALPKMSKFEKLILEPPSVMKRLVDKIVEFILRNGKQFEAVLIEQDSKHGRFPFLLPSNQYHPYYVKVLQKAQESKSTGKSFLSEKNDSVVNRQDKKTGLSKESDSLSLGSAGCEMPYDADRKEKFRMVIGKSKKDGQDPPSKTTQPQFGVTVDAAAAAAILQAATRGIKNANLGIFSSASLNGDSNGRNSEGGLASSLGSHLSSHLENVIQKSEQKGDQSVPVPVAKAIAKTAAIEAANEADSSEAHLSKEQKLKAERLKRAKMFVAMLKGGAEPLKSESLRSLSVEPQESGVSGSRDGVVNLAGKEREGSSVPLDVSTSEKNVKSSKKYSDEYHERRSRRKYRSSSKRHEEEEDVDEDEDEDEEEEKDHKHSRKKHRSNRSSHRGKDEEDKEERDQRHSSKKHRFYHSSHDKDDDDARDHKPSLKKHRSHRSSHKEEDEEEDYKEDRHHKHSRKKNSSHHSSRHSRDRHKHKERHSSSKNSDSRRQRKHDSSSGDEHHYHSSSSNRHRKTSHLEEELEEGEISSKMSDRSRGSTGGGIIREASVDVSSSYQHGRAPSQPSEAPEVSDDLRAKIRAMLMSTL